MYIVSSTLHTPNLSKIHKSGCREDHKDSSSNCYKWRKRDHKFPSAFLQHEWPPESLSNLWGVGRKQGRGAQEDDVNAQAGEAASEPEPGREARNSEKEDGDPGLEKHQQDQLHWGSSDNKQNLLIVWNTSKVHF